MGTVFINGGGGTVGVRAAHLFLSMDIPVIISKSRVNLGEGKTKGIIHYLHEFQKKYGLAVPLYAAIGDNLEERIKTFENLKHFLPTYSGVVTDIDYSCVTAIIDSSPSDKTHRLNHEVIYSKYPEIPVLGQGKGAYELADPDVSEKGGGWFLSAPNAVADKHYNRFIGKNASHVSCNTTFMGTATGLIIKVKDAESIRELKIILCRRDNDPEIQKSISKDITKGPKSEIGSHHRMDLLAVMPQLESLYSGLGRVATQTTKNPWNHYHYLTMDFSFHGALKDGEVDAMRNAFRKYERCIFVEGKKFSANKLYNACEKLGLKDGDSLLPVYSVNQVTDYSVIVHGFTPQRSIVGLSNVDWYHIVKGEFGSWKDAFDHTNNNVKWNGYRLDVLKHEMEFILNKK